MSTSGCCVSQSSAPRASPTRSSWVAWSRTPFETADAAVVEAEHGEAGAGEMVGEDEERAVAHERLVAVLRARAGQQDHGRERTWPFGQGEAAGQRDLVLGRADERGLAGGVRERRLGLLRPLGRDVGRLAGLQLAGGGGQAAAGLAQRALDVVGPLSRSKLKIAH
ncbi:hypothetical protein [Nannocystis pusilla]|uniref:hypothetical protein n=1 Tax=Nannocystis pusilla TaxID=889268 RepID=UPI003B82BDA1